MDTGYIPYRRYLTNSKHLVCQKLTQNRNRRSVVANLSLRQNLNQNAHVDVHERMQANLSELYSPIDWECLNYFGKFQYGARMGLSENLHTLIDMYSDANLSA